jgi:hypothetical protein
MAAIPATFWTIVLIVVTLLLCRSLLPEWLEHPGRWRWLPDMGVRIINWVRPWLGVAGWVIVAWLGINWVRHVLFYKRVKYTLTNQRLIIERGIVGLQIDEIDLRLVDDIRSVQGVVGRMFGFGNVEVTSNDKTEPWEPIYGILQPKAVREDIRDAAYAVSSNQYFVRQ